MQKQGEGVLEKVKDAVGLGSSDQVRPISPQ